MTGIGYGNFGKLYLYEQAAYFANQPYSEKELLLADNTYFVFNEYYKLIIELGIWIIIPLVIILIVLIRLIVEAVRTRNLFSYLFVSVLISILVASLFNNTFSMSYFWIIWLVQSIGSLWLIKVNKNIICLYVNVSILLLTIYVTVADWQSEKDLTNLKYEVRSGEYDSQEIIQRLDFYKPRRYSDRISILEIRSEFYIQQEKWEMARKTLESLVKEKSLNVSFANLAMESRYYLFSVAFRIDLL